MTLKEAYENWQYWERKQSFASKKFREANEAMEEAEREYSIAIQCCESAEDQYRTIEVAQTSAERETND